jgi:hypothetical protein
MLQSRLLAFVCVLMCLANGANAATIAAQSAALTPVLPTRGAYFDSSKSGTGVFVDVGLNGFVFLGYFGYDSLGAPIWHMIQAPWSPSTEAQRIATGVIGTLNSPLLYATGGQCITCDFTKPPTLVVEPYPVAVSWTTPRHLDLTIGNESWHMDAVQYSAADEQLLAGTWQLTISWDGNIGANASSTDVAASTQIAMISPGIAFGTLPIPTTLARDPDADPSIALPPAGSSYFPIETSALCRPGPIHIGTYGAAFADIFSAVKMSSLFSAYPSGSQYLAPMLWYDPATRRGGLDVVTRAMGIDTIPMALGPNNIHFDLYVEPDRVVGHGLVQGQNLKGVPAAYWLPDTVALNLVMERLPKALQEHSIYPCLLY